MLQAGGPLMGHKRAGKSQWPKRGQGAAPTGVGNPSFTPTRGWEEWEGPQKEPSHWLRKESSPNSDSEVFPGTLGGSLQPEG